MRDYVSLSKDKIKFDLIECSVIKCISSVAILLEHIHIVIH